MFAPSHQYKLHCQLCSCVMHKGKGKAAAAAAAAQASQPQLASQAMDSEDESPLEHDIAVTTELLEKFNGHADAWEALEVTTTLQLSMTA